MEKKYFKYFHFINKTKSYFIVKIDVKVIDSRFNLCYEV